MQKNDAFTKTYEDVRSDKINEKNLTETLFSDSFDSESWLLDFSFFASGTDRLMYSEITERMFSHTLDEYDIARKRLEYLRGTLYYRKEIDKEEADTPEFKLFTKLYDNCLLAISQRIIVEKSEESVKEEMQKLNLQMTERFIGLISIFTALSFVLSGGITALGSIMDAVRTQNLYYTLFVGLIWLLCMGNLFVLFMHFVMKISGKGGIRVWLYILVLVGEVVLCGLIGFVLLRSHIIIHI